MRSDQHLGPWTTSCLEWMDQGTGLFLREAVRWGQDLSGPSTLPGWTRAHVTAHVACNAAALQRLVRWASSGVETPMYADPGQRASEIEAVASQSAGTIIANLEASAGELRESLSSLSDAGWSATVRTAKGRLVPAAEIPWMRVREVWLHAVDLRGGFEVSAFPPELVDALLTDAAGSFDARSDAPALLLRPRDREREWQIRGSGGPPVPIVASAHEILGWLVGRGERPAHVPARAEHGDLRIPDWL